jgi:hypothetical protein
MHAHAILALAAELPAVEGDLKKYLIYAGVVVGAVIVLALLVYAVKRLFRGSTLRKLGKSLGFQSSRHDTWDLPKKCAFLPVFSASTDGRVGTIIHGPREGVEVMIFDYGYKEAKGLFKRRRKTTLVLFEMNYNFPFFFLRRERFSDKLAAIVGHDDIDFSSNKKFSSKFYVKAADPKFAEDLMSSEMMDFIMVRAEKHRINIEMSRSLMAFHLNDLASLDDLKWLYEFGWDFYQKTPEEAVARSR